MLSIKSQKNSPQSSGKYFSPKRSYWISSCAGSGKTTLLVERLQNLMACFYGQNIEKKTPSNHKFKKKGKILVLTFTRSASLEIQKRLLPKEKKSSSHEFFPQNSPEPLPLKEFSLGSFSECPKSSSSIPSNLLFSLEDFPKEIPQDMPYVVHTFHSFCWFLLQRFAGYGGIPKILHLLEEEQSFLLWQESIQEIFQRRCKANDQEFYHFLESGLSLKTLLEELFYKRLILKEKPYPCSVIQGLFQDISEEYERRKNLSLDYNDVLLWTLHLFHHENTMGTLGVFLHKTFQHILLDEGQDTNTIQWSIFSVLCEHLLWDEEKTLFALGDPKQCIYGFQGVSSQEYTAMGQYLHGVLNIKGFPRRLIFYHHQDHYRCAKIPLAFIHRVFQCKSQEFFGESQKTFFHRGKRQDFGGVFFLTPQSNNHIAQNLQGKKKENSGFFLRSFGFSQEILDQNHRDDGVSILHHEDPKDFVRIFSHVLSPSNDPWKNSQFQNHENPQEQKKKLKKPKNPPVDEKRQALVGAWCCFFRRCLENPFFLPSKNRLCTWKDMIVLFPRRNVFFYGLQEALRREGLMEGGYFVPKNTPFFQVLVSLAKILQENFVLDDVFLLMKGFFFQENIFYQWMYCVSKDYKIFLQKISLGLAQEDSAIQKAYSTENNDDPFRCPQENPENFIEDIPLNNENSFEVKSSLHQCGGENSPLGMAMGLFSLLKASTFSALGDHPEFQKAGDFLRHFLNFLQEKQNTILKELSWKKVLLLLRLLEKEDFFLSMLKDLDPAGPSLYKIFVSLGEHHGDETLEDFLCWFLDHPVEFHPQGDLKITTIHKSKGEEYPVVLLPDLPGPYGLMVDNGQGRDISKVALENFWLRGQGDYWSLFYVALTRCQDFLVLSSLDEKEKGWSQHINELFPCF